MASSKVTESFENASSALTLTHGMQVADLIRKNRDQTNKNQQRHSYPPGLLQGIAGFCFVGAAFLPVRRILLQRSDKNPAFRNFLDLMITVTHTLAATQVGLVTGSLYGANYYLSELRNVSTTAESPTIDALCNDIFSEVVPRNYSVRQVGSNPFSEETTTTTGSWDPRRYTIENLQEALRKCERRRSARAFSSHEKISF